MNTQKEARRDAEEYARAKMFYGEGAGNRRKLIETTVDAKVRRDPAYARAFHRELEVQDMAEHAQKARAERHSIDRKITMSKNIKAIARGDNNGVNASVIVIGAVAYVLHQTGYDKVIYDKVTYQIRVFRNRRKIKKFRQNVDNQRNPSTTPH